MTIAGLGAIFEREMIVGILERATREKLVSMGIQSFTSDKQIRSFWHPEHIVIGNFSVFNSIADHVLVQQHFPVVPISNLHVHPETTVRLVDITCDSDGEISHFYLQNTDKVRDLCIYNQNGSLLQRISQEEIIGINQKLITVWPQDIGNTPTGLYQLAGYTDRGYRVLCKFLVIDGE